MILRNNYRHLFVYVDFLGRYAAWGLIIYRDLTGTKRGDKMTGDKNKRQKELEKNWCEWKKKIKRLITSRNKDNENRTVSNQTPTKNKEH